MIYFYNPSTRHIVKRCNYCQCLFTRMYELAAILCADPPTFLEPLKDQVFHLHQNGKLECRVLGIPYPSVQFKKDWRPVAGSHRVKCVREGFDHWTLNIQNSIHMDEGVYECVAENLAGKVYCTATVKVTGTSWRK